MHLHGGRNKCLDSRAKNNPQLGGPLIRIERSWAKNSLYMGHPPPVMNQYMLPRIGSNKVHYLPCHTQNYIHNVGLNIRACADPPFLSPKQSMESLMK